LNWIDFPAKAIEDFSMTTYVYETIPKKEGAPTKRYEIRQSMKEPALTHHPETGEPIRRVILGGFGFVSPGGQGGSGSRLALLQGIFLRMRELIPASPGTFLIRPRNITATFHPAD
jgi:predicted nucleic acid-binding Zn ribbon protein